MGFNSGFKGLKSDEFLLKVGGGNAFGPEEKKFVQELRKNGSRLN